MRVAVALFCILLTAGAAAGGPSRGTAGKAASRSKETAADLKSLAAVDSFAVGGVGIAGTTSRGEELARAIAARPDAIAALEQLATGKNAAARVYAYWALRELEPDPKRVSRLLARLRRDHAEVTSVSGCIRYRSTVSELVAEIAAGQHTSLARPEIR